MPFSERFSAPNEEQRDSHVRVIDLSDPSRSAEERTPTQTEKEAGLNSLAKFCQARTQAISLLFEHGTKTQDTKQATELLEEARYWMEDLEQQLDFIREYREDTGEDEAFTHAASELIKAKKALSSEIDHMLEVVRIWHEDEPRSSAAERVEDEAEGIFEDINDENLIIEEAPKTTTMLTAANEAAETTTQPSEAVFLPDGYHEEAANDIAEEKEVENFEKVSPEEEQILTGPLIPSRIISLESEPITPSPVLEVGIPAPKLIDIPANLGETRSKFTLLNRTVREIETAISRKPQYHERERFDDYLIDLSRQYSAFEERLTALERHHGPETEEIREEKELIHDAMATIEDARHHLHEIDFTPKSEQEAKLEYQLDLKRAKQEKLSSIAERLTSAMERSGIKNPEVYMSEQVSGLGTIRRGLMKLFGKPEKLINKATLTKLRNEAVQAEENYLSSIYDGYEKMQPQYQEAFEKSAIYSIKHTEDVHEFWQAIHHEIDNLNEQTEIPLNASFYEGEGIAKASNETFKQEAAPVKEQARDARGEAVAYRKNELETIKASGLKNAAKLLDAIKKDSHSDQLTFLPADYVGALAELNIAIASRKKEVIERTLPKVESMRNEIADLWIDLTDENGKTIVDDEGMIQRAKAVLTKKQEKGTKKN